MANKDTIALSEDQYIEIIETMREGGVNFRPNEQIATILILEANLGLRISDIMLLKPTSFVKEYNRYRLNIKEKKTKKERKFMVPDAIYSFIKDYWERHDKKPDDYIFDCGIRNVQLYLEKVVDYLGYEGNIGTHSFRKFFSHQILVNNGYNVALVSKLLQHSSIAITQRYLGIDSKEMEEALANHVYIPQ